MQNRVKNVQRNCSIRDSSFPRKSIPRNRARRFARVRPSLFISTRGDVYKHRRRLQFSGHRSSIQYRVADVCKRVGASRSDEQRTGASLERAPREFSKSISSKRNLVSKNFFSHFSPSFLRKIAPCLFPPVFSIHRVQST